MIDGAPVFTTVAADASPLRFFPYESPYENQREAIERIHDALGERTDVLFEGACGTGKTLSALVPALEFAREEDKTVVITTNVHQQMRQFVADARAINDREPLRATVFKGKSSMCHIDVDYEECQVLRDSTKNLVNAEEDLDELEAREESLLDASQDGDADATEARSAVMDELESVENEVEELREESICEHYYNNLTADTDEFYAWLASDVRTPEEIYEYAEQENLCGYELLKDGMEEMDLVVCNYHHLLDPVIREQFFRWLGRDPEDVIAVFDEAHNVESAAREHATRTLTETTLDSALAECDDSDDPRAPQARNVVSAFRKALVATYDEELGFGEREHVGEDWEDLEIANSEGRDDLTLAFLDAYTGQGIEGDVEAALALGAALDREYDRKYRNGETQVRKECQTLQAVRFVESWLEDGASGGRHPVISVREGPDGVYGRAESFASIPRDVTEPLFANLHASVLMSATLRPFDVVTDVLGLEEPETMAYGLTFPEERRRTFAVDTPALFASERDDMDVQRTITDTLDDAIRFTPGNTLLFFPSYSEAERYHDRVAATTNATTYLDEPGEAVESLREQFAADEHGALFTSLWGTLAEGVSFDGDDAHTVVVVGVPYPHLDDRLEAVEDAYDAAYGAGWQYAVEIPTIRKTRQALGRVLRSPEEIGVRALLDARYTDRGRREMGKYGVRETFPEEERAELLDVAPEKLKFAMLNFYSDHTAYDGDPPTP
ncbi:ATP-dependent DNA helicase [Halococcus thailandensis]|uniref:DEAD_2 domain-containing protein n=1 Tax=Halococcus thailandensis JCM 13552 TaxID=1227457 RepID=M0N4V2_9EURY|nr:DEAD_2 domain-containing protein [Halococcus thailandensis JCM 13552]